MKAELIIDAPIIDKNAIWVKKVHKSNFDHPFHFHKICELTWLEQGHGKLIIGDYMGNYSEGELLLQSPELPHLFRSDPSSDRYIKAVAVYFPPAFISHILDDKESANLFGNLLKKAERGLRFYGHSREVIVGLIKDVVNSGGFEQLGYFLRIVQLLCTTGEYEFLASAGYKNAQNALELNRISEVYNYLFRYFQRDITLDEIAGICNMAPSAFCRFFKSKTQKTFVRFLTEIRISHACKLLQDENYSIKNIGYECGFNNPVIFFRSFKSLTGKTPKEYRLYIQRMAE